MKKLEEELKYQKFEKDPEYELPKELYGMLRFVQPYAELDLEEE